jgi:hypothetical protein
MCPSGPLCTFLAGNTWCSGYDRAPRKGNSRTRLGGAVLNVSPHDAHRQSVSFVISFASVPTFGEPQCEHVGRGARYVAMQPPIVWKSYYAARGPPMTRAPAYAVEAEPHNDILFAQRRVP